MKENIFTKYENVIIVVHLFLGYWSQNLESQKRFKDLFKCYEQAIEIFPENEEVYYQLAGHLFRYDVFS